MFVKIYSYCLKSKDLKAWKVINSAATKKYKKAGLIKSARLLTKEGKKVQVIEIDFYTSKKSFNAAAKTLKSDKELERLFKEFLKIAPKNKVTENELEVN